MLGVGIIAPILPLYAEDLGASGLWIGIIFASFSISRAVLMPLFGRLSDRTGRKPFLSIGLFSYSIISFGYIWADSVQELTLIRLIHGVAAGMIVPIAQAYVADLAPKGEEGKWMGYFNAVFAAGFGVGPLMGGMLTEYFGITTTFSAMGGLNLFAFLLVIFWLPEVKLKEIARGRVGSMFKPLTSSNMVRGLFSFRLSLALGSGIFFSFLPIFAATRLGLGPNRIGILAAVTVLLMSLLQFVTGNLADRLNKRALVIFGSLLNVVFLILVPFSNSFAQLLVLCALAGTSRAIAMPAASALNVEEGRKFGMGATIGIFTMAFSIGMAVGPLISGFMVDFINLDSAFYLGAGGGFIGTVLLVWFTRRQS